MQKLLFNIMNEILNNTNEKEYKHMYAKLIHESQKQDIL